MRLNKFALVALGTTVLSVTPIQAFSETCPSLFLNGQEPTTLNQTQTLCNEEYAVGFDTNLKEPRWSAEHLTRESITNAQNLKGRAQFHEDIKVASSFKRPSNPE